METIKSLFTLGPNKPLIQEFDLNRLKAKKHPSILIIARRGSGKSILITDLLRYLNPDQSELQIISPTDRMDQQYGRKYHQAEIKYELQSSFFTDTLVSQIPILESDIVRIKSKTVILDDCLRSDRQYENMTELIENCDQYQTTIVVTAQSVLAVSADLGSKFDYVFLFAENSHINQKKLYGNYGRVFPNCALFSRVLARCTEDYGIMVIDNKVKTTSISDKVFHYKVNHVPKPELDNSESQNKISEYNNFQIEQFNPSQIPEHFGVLIIGRYGCGKTVLIDDILRFNNATGLKKLSIISPKEKCRPHYKSIYPNADVKCTLEPDYISNIFTNNNERENKIFVLDDYPKFNKIKLLRDLLMNKKYLKTSIIVSTQLHSEVTHDMIMQFDYIFIFRETNEDSRTRLHKKFSDFFSNYESFEKILKKYTEDEDYGTIVIDNKNRIGNTKDKIFHYKATFIHSDSDSDCDFDTDSEFESFLKSNLKPQATAQVDYLDSDSEFSV